MRHTKAAMVKNRIHGNKRKIKKSSSTDDKRLIEIYKLIPEGELYLRIELLCAIIRMQNWKESIYIEELNKYLNNRLVTESFKEIKKCMSFSYQDVEFSSDDENTNEMRNFETFRKYISYIQLKMTMNHIYRQSLDDINNSIQTIIDENKLGTMSDLKLDSVKPEVLGGLIEAYEKRIGIMKLLDFGVFTDSCSLDVMKDKLESINDEAVTEKYKSFQQDKRAIVKKLNKALDNHLYDEAADIIDDYHGFTLYHYKFYESVMRAISIAREMEVAHIKEKALLVDNTVDADSIYNSLLQLDSKKLTKISSDINNNGNFNVNFNIIFSDPRLFLQETSPEYFSEEDLQPIDDDNEQSTVRQILDIISELLPPEGKEAIDAIICSVTNMKNLIVNKVKPLLLSIVGGPTDDQSTASIAGLMVGSANLMITLFGLKSISTQIQRIQNSIDEIAEFQDSEFRGKIMALLTQVNKYSTYSPEILKNSQLLNQETMQLENREHSCIELLAQTIITITKELKNSHDDYDSYAAMFKKLELWLKYHTALMNVLYEICRLHNLFNQKSVSSDYSYKNFIEYRNKSEAMFDSVTDFHESARNKYDIDLLHGNRKNDSFFSFFSSRDDVPEEDIEMIRGQLNGFANIPEIDKNVDRNANIIILEGKMYYCNRHDRDTPLDVDYQWLVNTLRGEFECSPQ